MLPTNDKDALLTGECTRLCPLCGVSECINPNHQPWLCACGHLRRNHKGMTMSPLELGYWHPHTCRSCDCPGLHYTTLDEAMREQAQIERGLRG